MNKEPTREQIKEAFEKTIKRWERIVEDPSYYFKSDCQLCQVYGEFEGDKTCHKYCPIRLYGDHPVCRNTPHDDFCSDVSSDKLERKERVPSDALAELNFLRKVYIWWMEGEANKIWNKHGIGCPKEEMEDKERACGDCESFELEKKGGEIGRCVSEDVWRGKEKPRLHRDWIACMYWRKSKEEKKEEWVDVTENIEARVFINRDGQASIRLYDRLYRFGYIKGQPRICKKDEQEYKVELPFPDSFHFCILRKI